ncbi:MAG: 2-oxo acid dehydrogenase subunit E2 [Halieaceae bacterium]|nr:2-oxo acid dehydrogenase subunit E2 [Halieaceae bacterium]
MPTDSDQQAQGELPVLVPDIGTDEAVEVIELSVAVGDSLEEGDTILVLESDKASMELPCPQAGELLSLAVKEGDQVRQGDLIGTLRAAGAPVAAKAPAVEAPAAEPAAPEPPPPEPAPAPVTPPPTAATDTAPRAGGDIYAGPAVRKLARELGVTLETVRGSGPKGRILKEDVQEHVKRALQGGSAPGSGAGIPAVPEVDYAAFGNVDVQPMTKIDKVTAANMHRSWLNVPHVTQFSEADVTALEEFRGGLKQEAESRGTRLTPLPFLLLACAKALRDNPRLNRAVSADGESFVYRDYVHIGIAVDTAAGLVVPVIRDVDKKGLWELAAEAADLASRAKDRKLKPADMQGACFTISSLGGLGGTGFTPIVNSPEVAILGVSKLEIKPVWDGESFQPRKMLPLSLSYDHRAVNGADGGRFSTQLCELLADIRRLLL